MAATTLSKEDVVRRKHRGQIQLGLVTYSYTGDSSSEDEDDDDSDIVRQGEARISWYPRGREEVLAEEKVTLHDRSLLPGDIVRHSEPGRSQKGLVKAIRVLCHLQVLNTRQMIYNIPSQDLQPIVPFQAGDHVVLGNWVGMVKETSNNVFVRFKNNARAFVSEDDACRLIDIHDNSDENSIFGEEIGFFPGQSLQGPASVFKMARWLGGPKPILGSRTRFRVTVEEIKHSAVEVQWCTRAISKNTADIRIPSVDVRGKDLDKLELLNFNAHASVQIGDKHVYTVKEEDLQFPDPVHKGSILCYRRPDDREGLASFEDTVDSDKGRVSRKSEQLNFATSVLRQIGQKLKDGMDRGLLKAPEMSQNEGALCVGEVSGVVSNGSCDPDAPMDSRQTNLESETSTSHAAANKFLEILCSDTTRWDEIASNLASTDERAYKLTQAFAGQVLEIAQKLGLTEAVLEMMSGGGGGQKKSKAHGARHKHPSLQHLPTPSELATHALRPKLNSLNGDRSRKLDSSDCQNGDEDDDEAKLKSLYENFKELSQHVDSLLQARPKNKDQDTSQNESSYDKVLTATRSELSQQLRSLQDLTLSKQEQDGASGEQDEGAADQKPPGEEEDGQKDKVPSGDVDEQEEQIGEDGKCDVSGEGFEDVSSESSGGDTDDDDEEAEGQEKEETGGRQKASSQKGASAKRARKQKAASGQPKKRKDLPVMAEPVRVGQSVCVEVTHTYTTVDVLWQDGSYESDIVSTDVIPCRQLDELEFFPGDFVTQGKGGADDVCGVVKTANNKERTCNVSWIIRDKQDPSKVCLETGEHSVYELSPHPDFVFSLDDVVVRLTPTNQGEGEGEEEEPSHELPPAGQVQEVNPDGTITVRWVDDTRSKVLPEHLYKILDDFDSEFSFTGALEVEGKEHRGDEEDDIYGNVSDDSWETASEDSGDESREGAESEEDMKDSCADEQKTLATCETKTEPAEDEAASAEQEASTTDSGSKGDGRATHQKDGRKPDKPPEIREERPGMDVSETEESRTEQRREDSMEEEGLQSPNAASRFIVEPTLPVSHYFSSVQQPVNRKQFLQMWRKEVRLLQTALPQGILVKAYEDRMDMFSVMIEGPVNTPYEDGVFFFDIWLLGDYPKTPPKVHYHSFCSGRLNPNLYSDGKVCLSLLGTWTGKGNEMWTTSSNLLQLLVSIQGLILVNEPYYNEAGYEKHRGTAESIENCSMYNEMALVKLVQSMTRMVSSPPGMFKGETLKFCQKHSIRLIRRLESWLESPSTDLSSNREMMSASGREDDGMSQESEAGGEKGPKASSAFDTAGQMISMATNHTSSQSDAEERDDAGKSRGSDAGQETGRKTPKASVSMATSGEETAQDSRLQSSSCSAKAGEGGGGGGGKSSLSLSLSSSSLSRSKHQELGAEMMYSPPSFALFPLSKGFVISLRHALKEFKESLQQAGIS